MNKCCVVGAFDFTGKDTGGQPVKTRELYRLLCELYGEENVYPVETLGWKRNPIKLVCKLASSSKRCNTLIMLPASNGVEIFARILSFIKKRSNKRIFYDVIGGWLPEKLSKEPKLAKILSRFDGIWVETKTMKGMLSDLGLNNISVIPNFKRLTPISPQEFHQKDNPPFALCTFSRVMKEKGIEDAVNAVCDVNNHLGKAVFTLDIYGQIDGAQTEWFDNLKATFPEYISYKGVASPSESGAVLKNYFALLFPTYYEGEGLAGTLIDSFAAGLPIIASDWKYNPEIVEDGVTGKIFKAQNTSELAELLENISKNPQEILQMKLNCLKKAEEYTPQAVAKTIENRLK